MGCKCRHTCSRVSKRRSQLLLLCERLISPLLSRFLPTSLVITPTAATMSLNPSVSFDLTEDMFSAGDLRDEADGVFDKLQKLVSM